MRFSSPWAAFFLLLVPLLILMYILKQKYEPIKLPSLFLWEEVFRDREVSTPWQKLKSNLLFILQLIILLSTIASLANPFLSFGNRSFENVVVAVDVSGSMNALYDKNTLLEEAKSRGEKLINSLAPGSRVSIISCGSVVTLELSQSSDKKEALRVLKNIKSTNNAGSMEESLSLVRSLSKQYKSIKVVFYTDSALNIGDLNADVEIIKSSKANASISYMSYSRDKDTLKVMVRVINQSKEELTREVSLYGEEQLLSIASVKLKGGETKTLYFDKVPASFSYLYSEFTEKDGLDRDNRYYLALLGKESKKVLLSSEKNVFMEKVLSSIKTLELYKTKPGQSIEGDYDLYVYDGAVPEVLPKAGALIFINPDKSCSLFSLGKETAGGRVEVNPHPLTKYLDKGYFTISKFKEITEVSGSTALMKAQDKDCAFYIENKGRVAVVLPFDLTDSDLPLTPEFPLFISNITSYLTSQAVLEKNNVYCGEAVELTPQQDIIEIQIINPENKVEKLIPGYPMKPFNGTEQFGIYTLLQKSAEKEYKNLFAVNFPPKESVMSEDDKGTKQSVGTAHGSISGFNLQPYLLVTVLLILMVEWLVYVYKS